MERFKEKEFKEYLKQKKIIIRNKIKLYEIIGEEIIEIGSKKIKVELIKYHNETILPYFKGFIK